MPQEELDDLFLRTRKSISLKHATCKIAGTGWGALENMLRKKDSTPQLDFGEVGPEQADWKQLLETGEMNDEPPTSYMVQDEWFELLKKAKPGWKVLFHLALNYYRRNDLERAYDCMNKSLALSQNAWNLQAQATFYRFAGRKVEASALFQKSLELEPDDASLAKSNLRALRVMEDYVGVLNAWNVLTAQVKSRPMNKFLYADALAHTGKLAEAEAIIMADGGLDIPDIREGEISTSELYIYIQVEKAKLQGVTLDPKQVQVPRALDLRMS
jgi:tetratricopeptide (TPR) repeat protein